VSVGVIGYSACHAGLNNQKLALLGLFVKALERSCAIALPELCNYSTSPAGAVSSIRFERVFDVPRLKAFGDAVGVPVLITPVFEPVSFDEGFQLGRQEDRSGLWDHESLSAQCWRALRPAPALAALFHRVIEDLFARAGITAVVQLRIEPDWQRHAVTFLPRDGRPTTYQGILTRVRQTLGSQADTILLTCDEAQVPAAEIAEYAKSELGMSVSFKSASPYFQALSDDIILRSLLDFELGLHAELFVGATHSTFANGIHSAKVAMRDTSAWRHYVYTAAAELLPVGDPLFKYSDAFKNDPFYAAISKKDPVLAPGKDPTWIPLYVRGHIAYQGDRINRSGWLRPGNDRHNFQGFSIGWIGTALCEIHYRARLADHSWTDWTRAPQFVGTRAQARDLTGFAVRLAEKDQARFRLNVIGEFTQQGGAVLVGEGEDCVPVLPGSVLAGMQVILRQV